MKSLKGMAMLFSKLLALFKGKNEVSAESLDALGHELKTVLMDANDNVSDKTAALSHYYQQATKARLPDNALELLVNCILPVPEALGAKIALSCGGLVEHGGDPEIAFQASCDLLKTLLMSLKPWCSFLPEEDATEADKQHWEEVNQQIKQLSPSEKTQLDLLIQSANSAVLPVMTMLMRSQRNFLSFINNEPLLSLIDTCYYADTIDVEQLYYLLSAAQLTYGELIVVLPASGTGIVVDAHAINNLFHAFTLLQPLLAKHAKALNIGKINKDVLNNERVDRSRYHWLTLLAYKDNVLVNDFAMAWGEANVSHLPRKDDKLVLIALELEKTISRSWDGFSRPIHDAQDPKMVFRRYLTHDEVVYYLKG